MIVDGAGIAREIEVEVVAMARALPAPLRLAIFTCEPPAAARRFLELKRAAAERIGVALSVEECAVGSAVEGMARTAAEAAVRADGIIVQLPFPPRIDLAPILAALPARYDVDVLGREAGALFRSGESPILPPVVGAIAEIVKRYKYEVAGKQAVVVGEGRLVGIPSAIWLRGQGADVRTVNRKTEGLAREAREADILVLGAGVPGLITPGMVRDGVVIFDAGASEEGGKLVGDAQSACADKAALFTPVPGGIGPITVALIFRNLLTLAKRRIHGRAEPDLL